MTKGKDVNLAISKRMLIQQPPKQPQKQAKTMVLMIKNPPAALSAKKDTIYVIHQSNALMINEGYC